MPYVTLDVLKDSMKITDDDRDDLLQRALNAAVGGINNTTGRRFDLDDTAQARVINPRRRVVCDEDGDHLLIKDIGSLDDLAVQIGTTSAWTTITSSVEAEPTDALDEGRPVTSLLRVAGGWPVGAGQRVRVTARWGWPQVPDVVAQATLIQAMRLFRRKDSPEGVTGSAEWGVVRLSRIDPDVQALIQSLILPGMA
jgi:hypothetical protein